MFIYCELLTILRVFPVTCKHLHFRVLLLTSFFIFMLFTFVKFNLIRMDFFLLFQRGLI